jgi:hypothetical protein
VGRIDGSAVARDADGCAVLARHSVGAKSELFYHLHDTVDIRGNRVVFHYNQHKSLRKPASRRKNKL